MFYGDLLGERARLTPEREALVVIDPAADTPERFTYGELDVRARRVASLLTHDLRIGHGERVGILALNSIEFLDLFFGCAKSGIIAVPLNTRSTAHELEMVARDCDMRLLFFAPQFRDTAATVVSSGAVPQAIELSQRDGARFRQLFDAAGAADDFVITPEGTCCLLYTSGTTGKQKGVMIPNRMIAWNAYNTAVNWGVREDDRTPLFTPLCHAGGLTVFLTAMIAMGATTVLHRSFDVHEVWNTIESERCTIVFGVPAIFKLLMEAPEFTTVNLGRVRWFISGGAPLPAYLIDAYQKRGVPFKQGFGMTEVGVNCFSMTVEDSYRKAGSIGRPMMFTQAKLVGEDGREVAPGEVGELFLRGPHVSSGYWKNTMATSECYRADGWFATGDYAKKDADGFFYIAGRKKEMFISGGVNIYPAEIESELVAHPDVSDAAVVGIPDEKWGEVGVAFVVSVPGRSLTEKELTEFLAIRIGRHKIPKQVMFLDELPRTAYGKVIKGELRKLAGVSA